MTFYNRLLLSQYCLPARGNNGNNIGTNGNYWSSTQNNSDNYYNLNFNSGNSNVNNNVNNNNNFSVLCVQ